MRMIFLQFIFLANVSYFHRQSFIDHVIVLSMFILYSSLRQRVCVVFVEVNRPCYCTVHVCVVIQLCDSLCVCVLFRGSESEQVFHWFVILVICFVDVYPIIKKVRFWDLVNQFNLATYLCMCQAMIWISKAIALGHYCVQ